MLSDTEISSKRKAEIMTFTWRGKVDNSNFYINDGTFERFVGYRVDKDEFIRGFQSGIKGNNVSHVRFDETLDVTVFEIVDGEAVHRPNLSCAWS